MSACDFCPLNNWRKPPFPRSFFLLKSQSKPQRRCYDACDFVQVQLQRLREDRLAGRRHPSSSLNESTSRISGLASAASLEFFHSRKKPTHQDALFSNISFASFTLVARYGLPPRSGWFSSINVRCALRTLSFVMLRSLLRPPSVSYSYTPVGELHSSPITARRHGEIRT
jgi:hypothetical protein